MPNEFKVKNGLNINASGSEIFSVDGTSGRLFQVDDSLSGSLFSVNTAAGLPVIEAFSDNTVRVGQYGQKALFISQSIVGIGLENPTTNLHVSGTTGGVFEVDGRLGVNALYVSASGAVGIRTTLPSHELDVSGSTRSNIYFTNYGTSSVNLLVSGQTPQISDRGIYIGSGTFNNASIVGVGIGSFINLGTGTGNVAIGYVAVANSGGVAIGSPGGVGATSDGGVALSGTTSNSARFAVMGSATAQGSISISSNVSQLNGIGIGASSRVSASHGIALGDRAVVGSSHTNSIAIGLFATTTAAKQLVIGGNDTSNNYAITDVYIGGGVQDLNLSNGTPVTINASGGNGTDKNGGNITIAGGKGTGTGTPGDFIIATSTTGSSGTTLQTLSNRVWIKGNTGAVGIGVSSVDDSALLEVSSTTKGFLPPKMTTTQRNAITSPAAGLIVYDTTDNKHYGYNGTTWNAFY